MIDNKVGCAYHGVAAQWVRGDLNGQERTKFLRHLTVCPFCQGEERHARVVALWEKCRENVYADLPLVEV